MEHQQYQYHHGEQAPIPVALSNRWWSKLGLRILSILLTAAAVGVSVYYYQHWTIGALLMMGPPAAVAFLWDWVDTICLFVRRGHCGVPPHACLTIDGILFLGLGAMSGVLTYTAVHLPDSGYYFAFFEDGLGNAYLHIVLVLGTVATLVHLAILILAFGEARGRRFLPPRIISVPVNRNGPIINQQAQTTAWSAEPPPAYSIPPQQAQSNRFQDQIQVSQPEAAPPGLAENKV